MRYDLPPVIQLLLDEGATSNPLDLGKRLKGGLLAELQDQAEGTEHDGNFYATADSVDQSRFIVSPAGSLDPVSPTAKCNNMACRLTLADSFCRTVGLLADEVVLPDIFTSLVTAEMPGDSLAKALSIELGALQRMQPLVSAGVIRFSPPVRHYCQDCSHDRNEVIDNAARQLAERAVAEGEFTIKEISADYAAISFSSAIFEEGVFGTLELHGADRRLIDGGRVRKGSFISKSTRRRLTPIISRFYAHELGGFLFEAETAFDIEVNVATASRLDVAYVTALAQELPQPSEFDEWERLRTVSLPLISKLSAGEVLQLRTEAAGALPSFRNKLARLLRNAGDTNHIAEIALELNSEAADVRSELDALQKSSRTSFNLPFAGGTLALVLVGATTGADLAVTTLTGLVGTMGSLHLGDSTARQAESKQKARPGYVLLKAKELLAARHERHRL